MPDVRGTRISHTSGDSWSGVGAGVVSRVVRGRIGQRRATRIHPYRERDCDRSTYWHFPCWYAGAVSPEGPVWAFLPGGAWPRCRRCEAPLPIAGRDAEGVVVTAVIAMAGALI